MRPKREGDASYLVCEVPRFEDGSAAFGAERRRGFWEFIGYLRAPAKLAALAQARRRRLAR